MTTVGLDEQSLKRALKEALTETLSEQRGLFQEVFAEVFEDLMLAESIREGLESEPVRREEIFTILEGEA